MSMIGLDLHKRETQLAIRSADGTICDRRIVTGRDRFAAALEAHPQSTILLEAGTESEWVAQHLETLGHTVIVADPNFRAMYATRRRGTKTDQRDARTLLEACLLGAYRPAHRVSASRSQVRAELAVRDVLVRTRVRYVNVAKALVRRAGLRVPSSATEHAARHLRAVSASHPALAAELAPLLALLAPLTAEIAAADARLEAITASDPAMALLRTMPGIGPVTASAFVATIDDVTRFRSAHALEAYLGLVPRERSSGETRRLGPITRAGNTRVRTLLVEAAQRMLRRTGGASTNQHEPLRAWATDIAGRRGRNVAAVALARRIAGILYAMWRDGVPYNAARLRSCAAPPTGAPPNGEDARMHA